ASGAGGCRIARSNARSRGVDESGKEMSYQVHYDYSLKAPSPRKSNEGNARIEEFETEQAALGRARELLDGDDHHAVAVRDDRGDVLCGVRLQLKLGWFPG